MIISMILRYSDDLYGRRGRVWGMVHVQKVLLVKGHLLHVGVDGESGVHAFIMCRLVNLV